MMKNKFLIVSATAMMIFSLNACKDSKNSNSSTSSTQPIPVDEKLDEALEKAKKNVTFSGNFVSVWTLDNTIDEEGQIYATIGSDFYQTTRIFQDFAGRTLQRDHLFVKGEDGKIYDRVLTLQNKVEDKLYVNDDINADSINYDDYCKNPFASLTVEDFYIDENNRYALKENAVSAFNGFASFETTQDLSFYEVNVEKVTFDYENGIFNEIVITSEKEISNYQDEEYYFEFTFDLEFQDQLSIPEIKTKEHKDGHDVLKTALEKLQAQVDGGNYTIHAIDADSTDHDEIWLEYDNYYVEDECFSDFKAAFSNYKEGYKKQDDGMYHQYNYYVSGDKEGQTVYIDPEKSSTAILSREQLDVNFLGFAPEFFTFNADQTIFTTTDSYVVDAIRKLVAPFYDAYDPFLVGTKVIINLNSNQEVDNIVCTAYDWANEYTDDFIYTYSNFGTTQMPVVTADK